ncbi:MAG: putative glucarate transporter [Steroidobacteraceae bacterium]|nr:putative glucarate transporter [Steroidobacteraceae bacterium]
MPRPSVSAQPVVPARSRSRFRALALICIATSLNYLDRAVIGVAAPAITQELSITPTQMGIVFSAFSWTYAFCQIPGGVVLDRLGTKITYTLSLGLWSLFALLHGTATGVVSLVAMRLALGVAEAPCFPTNSKVLSTWFPQQERARATSAYAVGQYAGLAFFSPVLFWIVMTWGWRSLFVICGAIGIVYAGIWYALYRDPQHSSRVNAAELEYIRAGGAVSSTEKPVPFSWRNVRTLLGRRQIIGAAIGQFCSNSTLVFFLTWFPTYLATERHMNWVTSGVYSIMPFLCASAGVILGGVLSDAIIMRTGSANWGRKLPIIIGLLLASMIVLANFVNGDRLVIGIMSIAFLGQGMGNLGWTLVSDISPRSMFGLTGGIFNFCTNLSGITTPIIVGLILAGTGSFYSALAFIALLALLGALTYIFVIGDVHRLEIE